MIRAWFQVQRVGWPNGYATSKLHGAVAALSPVGDGIGRVAGYTAADYLVQQASRERRYARVPASTWDAVLSHVSDPADAARLADSASSRLLHRYAVPLYRYAADAGDKDAAWELVRLLAGRGDLDEAARIMRGRVDAGEWGAEARRADLLADVGDLDGLRALANAGGWRAAWRLAELLAGHGDLDELRALANAGDRDAALQLTDVLVRQGRGEEAEQLRLFGFNPDGLIASA